MHSATNASSDPTASLNFVQEEHSKLGPNPSFAHAFASILDSGSVAAATATQRPKSCSPARGATPMRRRVRVRRKLRCTRDLLLGVGRASRRAHTHTHARADGEPRASDAVCVRSSFVPARRRALSFSLFACCWTAPGRVTSQAPHHERLAPRNFVVSRSRLTCRTDDARARAAR